MALVGRTTRVVRVGVRALLIAGSLAIVVGGLTASVQVLRATPAAGSLPASTGPGPFGVAEPVRTRLGVVQVTAVSQLGGLSSQDLSGANHGIANLVPAGQTQVQVTLRVTNDTAEPVAFSPGLVTLRAGDAAGIAASSATLPGGHLTPGVSREGTLGFVAPGDGSALRLELPGIDGAVAVDLGRAAAGAAEPTTHH